MGTVYPLGGHVHMGLGTLKCVPTPFPVCTRAPIFVLHLPMMHMGTKDPIPAEQPSYLMASSHGHSCIQPLQEEGLGLG